MKTIFNAVFNPHAAGEFTVTNSLPSNSLALCSPLKYKYNILLTKERSEIPKNITLLDQEMDVAEKAQHFIDIMLEVNKSAYTDTVRDPAFIFQTRIREVVVKINLQQPNTLRWLSKGKVAVKKYLKALIDRDLKILRDLILEHLLCTFCTKKEKDNAPSDNNDDDSPSAARSNFQYRRLLTPT